jgi:hypothetical protein
MKRYSLSDGGIRGNFDLAMTEHTRGEWVRFEDVEKSKDIATIRAVKRQCEIEIESIISGFEQQTGFIVDNINIRDCFERVREVRKPVIKMDIRLENK